VVVSTFPAVSLALTQPAQEDEIETKAKVNIPNLPDHHQLQLSDHPSHATQTHRRLAGTSLRRISWPGPRRPCRSVEYGASRRRSKFPVTSWRALLRPASPGWLLDLEMLCEKVNPIRFGQMGLRYQVDNRLTDHSRVMA
jgi:hypothetical protein